MKKNNKRLDFLPNIQNKYSIRKFTVGTASILVSSLLFLGISNNASASTEDPVAETATATLDAAQPNDAPKETITTTTETQPNPDAPAQQNGTNQPADATATQAQPQDTPKDQSEAATQTQPAAAPATPVVATRAAAVPGSSLNATDNMIGPDPVVQTGVTKAADLPALTKEQVQNVNNQITWLDFSDPDSISNPAFSDTGQLALKVGTKYEKEIMPGLVVTATVKSLQPFEATPMYARRAEGDDDSGYNPHATNIVRKDAHADEIDKPAYVVVTKQDPNWSHLKKAGVDTGEGLTNFGSNRNYGNVGATFEVKTTYNGQEVPANIVMSDGEEAKNIEALIYTTNGSGWELFTNAKNEGNPENYHPITADDGYFIDSIDKGEHGKGKYYVSPDKNFGGLGTQIFGPNQTRQDENSVPIVVTTGATEVSFFVNSTGIQTVQMGFVILDTGDAPSSYGEAIHAITETANVSQPFLGTQKADIDLNIPNKQYKEWQTDNLDTPNTAKAPDEGEQQLVGENQKYIVYNAADQTYSLDIIANTSDNDTSFVRGWVDFNNNGLFDEKEKSELATVSRTGSDGKIITLLFKNLPQITDDSLDYLGVRVRTSLAEDSVNLPNGVAYSGEVEDFEIKVVHPPRGEKSETNGLQGQPQTSKAVFTAHGRVEKDWPKVNEMDTTVAVKIVDDNGNLVSTLTVPGEGKYDVAPDGTITFTPEPQFTGTAKGIVLRGTDLNGNTSGWTSNTAENNLENNNLGVNGTTTMDAVYIPTVTPVTPTADPVETTDIQGQPQTGTPVFKGGDPAVPIDETVAPKLIDPATDAKVDTLTVPGEGTYKANPDGTVTFTPEPQFVGTATPVKVERVDKNGTPAQTTYTPNVTAVTPTVTPAESEGTQSQPQTGTPTFEGGNPLVPIDETVAPKLIDPNTGDKVDTLTVPGEGTYKANPDGTVTFTPEPKFVGKATPVKVERVDTNGTPAQTTYTPNVTSVKPVGTPAESEGPQGQPQSGTPTFEGGNPDVPIDENVAPKLVDPTTGNEVDKVTVPGEGTYTVDPNGKVTFTPEPQFKGDAKGVDVKRVDKNGTPVTAKYTPKVNAVTPTANPAETTGVQGKTQTGTPTFEGGDPLVPIDETVAPKLIDPATGAKVDTLKVPNEGTYVANPDGTVTFTPEPQFVGKATPVKVERVDTNGTPVQTTYTPKVTAVTPVGTPAESEGPQGQPQSGTPTFEGGDPAVPIDENVAPKLVDPKTGNEVDKVTVPGEGTYTVDPNGKVTFTPEPQFKGNAKGVDVKRVDKNGTTVTAKYTPKVNAVTPVGTPTESEGPQGQSQTDTPVFKGGDPAVPIDENVAPKLIDPATGAKVDTLKVPNEGTYTANADGTVTFTPEPQFVGKATPVKVERVDTNGTPAQTTYTPNVTAVTPVGTPATSEGPQGQPQKGTPTFKGGDPLVPIDDKVAPKLLDPKTGNEVDKVTVPGEGTYTVDPNGKVTFTPEPQFKGDAKGVEVKRVDKNGTTVTAKYSPKVNAVTPVGTPVTSEGPQGQPQKGTPTFKGGDPLVTIDDKVAPKLVDPKTGNEVDKVTVPGEGTYTVDPNGKVTFTPDPKFTGEGKGVEVKRVDKNGTPVTAKYTPSVTPVTPVGTPVTSTGVQGQPQEGTPTFKGGDPLVPIDSTIAPKLVDPNTGEEVNKVVIPGEGTYTIDPNGEVTFTPDPKFTGEGKGILVKRVDKNGTTVTAKFIPNVTAVTPKGTPATSEGPQGEVQNGTPTFESGDPLVPIDNTIAPKLVDPNTGEEVDKVVVPGEGTYTIDPNGEVTFTPDPKFTGEGKGVLVKRVDKNGTAATAKYTPTVIAKKETPEPAKPTPKDPVEPKHGKTEPTDNVKTSDEVKETTVANEQQSKKTQPAADKVEPKQHKDVSDNKSKAKALPNTGTEENNTNTTLFGSLLALFGLAAFSRRKKEDKE